jgi:hypothetical protein
MWRKEAQAQLLKAIDFERCALYPNRAHRAEFEQKGGDAAHPAAGDTDQMDRVPLSVRNF